MAKEFFKDLPDTTTPLTATRLNGLLDGEEVIGNIVVDSIRTKNMFDKNSVTNGYFYTSTGGTSTDTETFIQNAYIEVKPNTSYTFSASSGDYFRFCEYDSNKTFIQRQIASDASSNTKTYTTSSTTNYVRVSCNITNLSSLQLEEGSTATTYTPYQNLEGNNFLNAIWSGNVYAKNVTTSIGQNLEAGKLYVFEVKGLSSSYYEYISFIANGGSQSIQHTTYDGSTAVRWRINLTANTFLLDNNSLNMSANTAVVNLYKLS